MDRFGVVNFGAAYCCSCSSSRVVEIYWWGVRGVWAVKLSLDIGVRFLLKADQRFVGRAKVVRDDVVFGS